MMNNMLKKYKKGLYIEKMTDTIRFGVSIYFIMHFMLKKFVRCQKI